MRVLAQRLVARRLGLAAAVPLRPHPRADVDPVGAVALLLGGTGWGRGAVVLSGRSGPRFFALAAGPVLVLAASQAAFAAFRWAYPGDLGALAVNRPSDVLRGVVAASSRRPWPNSSSSASPSGCCASRCWRWYRYRRWTGTGC